MNRGAIDAWRLEEACANAAPSWRELRLDSWMVRAAGGHTRRLNSVNPLHAGAVDPAGLAIAAEAVYDRLRLPLLFRIPDLLPKAAATLDRLGYVAESETLTLVADPSGIPAPSPGEVDLKSEPGPWLAAWRELRPDLDDDAVIRHGRSLDALMIPAAFACRRVAGQPVAAAYVALDRGIAVFESVVTHPDHRGRGHARAVVRALMGWCATAGAETVCLQVAADNAPARALYAGAGFCRELYRYHYRRRPPRG